MAFDYTKERSVLRGPFSFFDGSIEIEVLDCSGEDASALLRCTYKAGGPLANRGRQHPQVPPLHLHFDQTETFKVLQGSMAVAVGYDQKEIILHPDNTPFDITPMLPHTPYPRAGGTEDTIAILRVHPDGTGETMDDVFFEHIFKYMDECWRAGNKPPDLVQIFVMQHATASALVMFPSAGFLGSWRWWIPWKIQSMIASVGRMLGYKPLIEKYLKED